MSRLIRFVQCIALALLVSSGALASGTNTPAPSPTPPSPSPTRTSTATRTSTGTPTATPTWGCLIDADCPHDYSCVAGGCAPQSTATPTITPTVPTATATRTVTTTATPRPTRTPRVTVTPSVTALPTGTSVATATGVMTSTPAVTSTSVPPTATASPVPTGSFVAARIKPEWIEWPTPVPTAEPGCVLVEDTVPGQWRLSCVPLVQFGAGCTRVTQTVTLSGSLVVVPGLIPGNSILMGVASQAVTTITGTDLIGYDVGRSVPTQWPTAWGNTLPLDASTTPYGSYTMPEQYDADTDVEITPVGGLSFSGGTLAVTAIVCVGPVTPVPRPYVRPVMP